MTITVDLLKSNDFIEQQILKEIASNLNKSLAKNKNKITAPLKRAIEGWLLGSPEVQSLLSTGDIRSLNSLFGLSPGAGASAVSSIINSVANSVDIKFTKISSKDLSGSLEISFQKTDFSNILSLPQGHQVTEVGTDLHWLDWLLTKGDAVIIAGFFYDPTGDGRSGGGVMKVGGTFRVPPQYSGTTDNNFITRAFANKNAQISKILSSILK